MKLSHLITREISHRKGNFFLSILGAALAVTSIIATVCLLKSHEKRTAKEMAGLEDKIRKSMKGLGFNIYIFPKGQEMEMASEYSTIRRGVMNTALASRGKVVAIFCHFET